MIYSCFSFTFYRFTKVERSYHLCGTIVSQWWNDRLTRVKRFMGNEMEAKTFGESGMRFPIMKGETD